MTRQPKPEFDFRWGVEWLDKSRHGGADVPGFVLRHYHELNVSPLEMMLIIHLSAFHFNSEKGEAKPSLRTIADMMGYVKDTTVRRLLSTLEEKKLVSVKRQPGRCSIYDFSALAQRCLDLDVEATKSLREEVPPKQGVLSADGVAVPPNQGVPVPPKQGDEDQEYKTKKKRDSAPSGADAPTSHSDETSSTSGADVVASESVVAGDDTPAPDVAGKKPVQPHVAIIDAWYDGQPAPPIHRKYKRNVVVAKRILDAGYAPEQVRAFVEDRYRDPWWHDKTLTLEKVEEGLPAWVKVSEDQRRKKAERSAPAFTPEEIDAIRDAQFGPMPLQKAG